jgi:hypothetical protein
MTKHTPAPWMAVNDRVNNASHFGVAQVLSMPMDKAMADARLIAAAPDMLAALYLAEQNATDRTALAAIRAAIAKATGA